MRLINEIGFDTSFSFIYSTRPGTPAAFLPDDIPLELKKERLSELQDRIQQNAAGISSAMVGSSQIVLVESRSIGIGYHHQDVAEFIARRGALTALIKKPVGFGVLRDECEIQLFFAFF